MTPSLELGSGQRPQPGYVHTDVTECAGVKLDQVSPAWLLDYPDDHFSSVIALGVMEHLTYAQFEDTLDNVRRMLTPHGHFLFDVPDLCVWARYLADHAQGIETPFPLEHILSTIYGWQRWPGDEHQSGWTLNLLVDKLEAAGFKHLTFGVDVFLSRGLERRRMTRPEDAHLYVECR